jgi:hypothetical protein
MEPEDSLCHPKAPILGQINQVCTPPSHSLRVYFNIIFPSTPRTSQLSISLRFPHQNPECTSSVPHAYYVPRHSHYSRFAHRIIFVDYHRSLSFSLCNLPPPHFRYPSILGQHPLSDILNPCTSLSVTKSLPFIWELKMLGIAVFIYVFMVYAPMDSSDGMISK